MKKARTFGYIQSKDGARYRVTSPAVAKALQEADERVANLKALLQKYAAEMEEYSQRVGLAEKSFKALRDHWWVSLGRRMGAVPPADP